jgi:thiol-disulfide isomerase/thioredoxin
MMTVRTLLTLTLGWFLLGQWVPESRGWQDPVERPTEVEIRRELNRRLSDESLGLDSAVTYLDSVLEHVSSDSDLHLIAISLNTSRGVRFLGEDKPELALTALTRAETLARGVLGQAKPLLAAEREMLGEVFFFVAQARAFAPDRQPMYQALDQAFELGFEQLEQLREAKPFAALQDDDAFQAYYARQKALVPERQIARLRQEFANFEAFEFDFDLTTVDDKKIVKRELLGKILVVDVWGTWCPPCRQELPRFIALQEKFASQGVQVVGLNTENDETPAARTARVIAAIEEFKINYPCALIDDDFLTTIPDFEGFPTTLLIDGQGRVRLKMVGAQPENRLELAVQFLLDEAKQSAK